MRAAVSFLALAATAASVAWSAALPPSVAAMHACAVSVVAPGPFPKTATDPLGELVALRAAPRRIVSLSLNADEILLDLVPPDRIAALTIYVDDPATSAASTLAARVPGRVSGEPESLLALAPDLVIASAYTRPETLALVEGAGVPIIGSGAHATLDDMLRAITTLGDAVGEPERARALVDDARARIDAVRATRRGPRPRVLLWDGGYTYGAGTMEDDLVRVAGGDNVAASIQGAAALTEEAALALAPDVVLVPIPRGAVEPRAPALVGDDPIWRAVPAVQRGAVHGVPRAWLGSLTQHAVRGLEAVAAILDGAGA
jgi:iron complex transport system substrate-binding protein